MNGPVYHTIERGSRRFDFLKGWHEASVSQITSVFEPSIDMVLADRPPPAGVYYFAGRSAKTSYFQVPIHDVPSGATCECGSTAEREQRRWRSFWGKLGTPPRDNVIYYNLKAVTGRLAQTEQEGYSKSCGHWLIASFLFHELYHVKHHQKMLHEWEGEAEAHEDQRDFMTRTADLFGVHPEFLEAWRLWSQKTERDQESEWRQNHPSWRGLRDPIVPRP
jgi:hypothetical protein